MKRTCYFQTNWIFFILKWDAHCLYCQWQWFHMLFWASSNCIRGYFSCFVNKKNMIYFEIAHEKLFKSHVSEGSVMWWIASKKALMAEIFSGDCSSATQWQTLARKLACKPYMGAFLLGEFYWGCCSALLSCPHVVSVPNTSGLLPYMMRALLCSLEWSASTPGHLMGVSTCWIPVRD